MKFLLALACIALFFSCGEKQEKNETSNQQAATSNQQPDTANLQPLDKLKTGNEKFVNGRLLHPNETVTRIHELKNGQKPFVVVVSCSDSRLPPEIVFDQGLGDVFSIRTAGNVIGDYELGSIEYAVEHLHCKLIIVMGHENCGAIQAYAQSASSVHGEVHNNDHIQSLVSYISSEQEEKAVPKDQRSNIDTLVRANILHGVNLLKSSTPILKPLFDKSEIQIIGAYYDLDSGRVLFEKQ